VCETMPRNDSHAGGEWCDADPPTDESASSIDAEFEIDGAVAARSRDRQALWRVVARSARRTQRRARRQRRFEVETALRVNRHVVWRQHWEVSSHASGPPPDAFPIVHTRDADGEPDGVSEGHRAPPRKKRLLSGEGTASFSDPTLVPTPTQPAARTSEPTTLAAGAVVVFKDRAEPLPASTAQQHRQGSDDSRVHLAAVALPPAVDSDVVYAGRRRQDTASAKAPPTSVVSLRL